VSFTAVYTPLYPLDVPAETMSWTPTSVGGAVKITDPEGLDEHVPDWDTEMDTDEYTDRGEYPASTWERLGGFKTWDAYDYYNIERLGFYYNREKAVNFWGGISKYTEPFQFFTSPYENDWPHVLDVVTQGEDLTTMHVVCHSGDVWMHEFDTAPSERRVVE
jgi:hypothetical protein